MAALKGKFIQFIFNLFGKTVYASKAKGINKLLIFNKTNEPDCYYTIIQLLKYHRPQVVFDIGANEGNWSKTLLELNPETKEIHLFEPQKKLHEKINQNLQMWKDGVQIKLYQIGLGDKFYKTTIKGGGAGASILNVMPDYAFADQLTEESENIDVHALDEWVTNQNLPYPDLIKIDVQGFEYEILQGALQTLQQCKFLIVELSFDMFYQNQQPVWKIFQLLHDNGFLLADTGFEWRKNYDFKSPLLQTDGIFYNKKLVVLN